MCNSSDSLPFNESSTFKMFREILEQSGIPKQMQESIYESAPSSDFRKGQTVLDTSQRCDYIYLVEQGLLRMYYIDRKGIHITQWFAPEDTTITAGDSFFDRTLSKFYIEALEDSKVKLMTLDTLNTLCDASHEFERFARLLIQKLFLELTYKIEDQQFKTSKERYDALINRYPDISRRAKLGHIASYIGITQQSLSRIRSQK